MSENLSRHLRGRTPSSRVDHHGSPLGVVWGDLHNHCGVGLFHHAHGTLERSIENARSHLDFFAFTGHSQWHDMPAMTESARKKWVEGFDYHTRQWPRTKELIAAANRPGEFVAFLGYEWHSSKYGDRCIIFPDDRGELAIMGDLPEVEALARASGALLYPHHIGYQTGMRGINWDEFDPALSPVIEIQSEHGCAEWDRGPYPYITHSLGGRTTGNTYRAALERGFHCGVAGGSDDHAGFPGAYREGLIGVFASGLTRAEILEGVWKRRTIASTGDRVGIDFRLNEGFIGDILAPAERRALQVSVSGWDEIDRVELLKNNSVIHSARTPPAPRKFGGERRSVLLRFEYGWGPWAAMTMARTADWEVEIEFGGAELLAWQPCFQTAPFDEQRRHAVEVKSAQEVSLRSYTSRAGAFLEVPTNALVFELEGGADDLVTLRFQAPARRTYTARLGDLFASSRVEFLGEFPFESFLLHRLVPKEQYRLRFELTDEPSGEGEDFYYVRAVQTNNQLAWSSPIWVGA